MPVPSPQPVVSRVSTSALQHHRYEYKHAVMIIIGICGRSYSRRKKVSAAKKLSELLRSRQIRLGNLTIPVSADRCCDWKKTASDS